MHEFCLEATHELLGNTIESEESLLCGVFAIRRVDEVLVMLRILDFRQLPQTRRTVMTARVKANLRYPSHRFAQIYSMQESSDKSKALIELYISTNKTFKSLLLESTISIERAIKLMFELVYGVVEVLDYYTQRSIILTPDILCNAILLPDTLFVLHDDTILLPNPCITVIDAELGRSNRILKKEQWIRYSPSEISLLILNSSSEITSDALEKALVWSVGVLVSDIYSILSTSYNMVRDTNSIGDNNSPFSSVLYAIQELIDSCLVANVTSRIDCRTLLMNLETIQHIFLSSSIVHNPMDLAPKFNTSLTSDEEGFLVLSKEHLPIDKYKPDTYDIHDVFNESDYNCSLSTDYFYPEEDIKAHRHSICYSEITCYKTTRMENFTINKINYCNTRSKSEYWSSILARNAFQRYIIAATTGNSNVAAIYVNKYAKHRAEGGITALMAAVKTGKHECVSLLAQHEARIQDDNGLTALMYAVNQHDVESIRLLSTLECRLIDNQGMTALMHAVVRDYYDIIHLLIAENDIRDLNHMSAYDIAEELGHSRCAFILEPYSLQMRALNITRINEHGYTALMFATIQNDIATVQRLAPTEGGAVAGDGSTALHIAILHNKHLCIPPLLRYERSIMTSDGITPLKFAEKLNRHECVRILQGPPVKGYLSTAVESLLMKAARAGDPELLTAHLDDVSLMTARGETALMIAAAAGNYRCVKELLPYEQGIVSPDGWTALMYASSNGHIDCVSLLCTHEAAFTNVTGQLAYDIAIERGHKGCAQLLSKHEKYLTVAYRIDELLALDHIDEAVKLLKQPFVPSNALVKCIWNMQGGEFMALWGTLRANADLKILAKYVTLSMSVDLNDPELTDLVLKSKMKSQISNTERIELENLLHKALIAQKFLVIPIICDYIMNMNVSILVHKRVGKAVTKKTKLMLAAELGDLVKVKENLHYLCCQHKGMYSFQGEQESFSLSNHYKTVNSVTALMLAAANGHSSCIHALLPEMGLRDQASGTTALILAIWCENAAIVRLLLPEVGIADNSGVTPLMHASKKSNKKCAKLIEAYLKKRR